MKTLANLLQPVIPAQAGIQFFFMAAIALACNAALAKVTPEEAEKLRDGTLMPLGGEMKGNADGSIPAWTGGLTTPPPGWKNGDRLVDPFPGDKPLFTITHANLAQHRDRLTEGQVAMFRRHPSTYRMPVYPSRRTTANPQYVYDATFKYATTAVLADGQDALQNWAIGIPFPIPKSGAEAVWNHKLRSTGIRLRGIGAQLAVNEDGSFSRSVFQNDAYIVGLEPDMTPEKLAVNNLAFYYMSLVKKPTRDAGTVYLTWSPVDQKKEPQMTWLYNPGQKRMRRAPSIAYDTPTPGTDGQATVDQYDAFNGAMNRYQWRLVGKKEIYVPYNAYRLHSDKLKYRDWIRPGHINHDHAHYELHRVWVVEATLKPGLRHAYSRRMLYLDEDSWTIVTGDCYDGRGMLWRIQEMHQLMFYDPHEPHIVTATELVYDLQNGRYLATGNNEEESEIRHMQFPPDHFQHSNMEKMAGGG